MFKFAIKAGLAYSAIYYVKEEGIWKKSDESLKAWGKINTCPYLTTVKQQIPFEIPKIPDGRLNQIMKQYWNCGVLISMKFLSELPAHSRNWSKKGADYIIKQTESVTNAVDKKIEEKPKDKK